MEGRTPQGRRSVWGPARCRRAKRVVVGGDPSGLTMDLGRRRVQGVTQDAARDAEEFDHLYRAVYLAFHRRDGRRSELSGASRAVLNHLALAGPLTVGEAAVHLDRAQSVVSDIVTQLERKGLLERESDPVDRRRTLVWLTPVGVACLAADQRVLSVPLLEAALSAVAEDRRSSLLDGMRILIESIPRGTTSTEGGS
jgi:DNA-binding MarR family transcriptional regulator